MKFTVDIDNFEIIKELKETLTWKRQDSVLTIVALVQNLGFPGR